MLARKRNLSPEMADTLSVFVMDSFAVIAHFEAESGGEKVLELLETAGKGEIVIAMSQMNVGEVAYLVRRERGKKQAEALISDLRSLPITFYEVTEERIFAAAWLKADYPISYADAFAASLAIELKGELITGNPEFKLLEKMLSLVWLE
jgi:predicted nucleic acid-binding protein